jgi:putative transposase
MLVDTQGNMLGVKVLAASSSDQEGARSFLTSLKDALPTMKLLWGDSHYGGTFIEWRNRHVGWYMQVVRALTMPKRGRFLPEGEQVDWDKLFPKGFRPQPRRWIIERSFSWIVRWRRLLAIAC